MPNYRFLLILQGYFLNLINITNPKFANTFHCFRKVYSLNATHSKCLFAYTLNVIWDFSIFPSYNYFFCFLFYYAVFSNFIFLIPFSNRKFNFFKCSCPYLLNGTWNIYSLKVCSEKCTTPYFSLKPSFNSIIFKLQPINASTFIISTLSGITIFSISLP